MMLARVISPKLLFHAKPAKTRPNDVRAPAFIRSIMSEKGQAPSFETPRLVLKTVLATEQPEGDGAVVRRSIGRRELRSLDPFLLLDHFSVTPPGGFHDHPHRGFETVTYMFQGAITHQDFAGNKGTIQTGDVQWMTAGRGIVHSEMPTGGLTTGLQLWINLSSKYKMIEPSYQELLSENIERAEEDGVEVRVIAGESMGVRSPVHTLTPTMYLDFTLKPGAELRQSIPESWNSFVYIIEGEGVLGSPNSAPVAAHNLLVLGPGDGLSVWNRSSNNLRFVLLGGQPLNEPMAKYGPFVMNTQAEINRTLEDFKHFKNGFELARTWRSQ
ncbi:hypothetical protein F2P56_015256 [Juglans regia]|uniref:Pirin-like protein n=2 Tax=Juglans regia TaxID=51240 RepID=A0A834CV79_JUGRE|nr:pirin-like protein [Juglans regia]KAF5465231.1 hypothetical protein F2P56_015256 [Juglans regia]